MKSDRQTYRRPREPVNKRGFAWNPRDWIPAFAGMTNWCGLSTRGRNHPERNEGSATVNEILRPEKVGLRKTDSLCGNLPLAKLPTGFSESDVGGIPGAECDAGRTLDKLVSSELETTRLIDDEVHNGYCLAMARTRFQTCPELVEGCQN